MKKITTFVRNVTLETTEEKRAALILYMKEKARIFGSQIFSHVDQREIELWSDGRVLRVFDKLVAHFSQSNLYTKTFDACPWCIANYRSHGTGDCDECGYGDRHGRCREWASDYTQYMEGVDVSRTDAEALKSTLMPTPLYAYVKPLEEIIEWFGENYGRICCDGFATGDYSHRFNSNMIAGCGNRIEGNPDLDCWYYLEPWIDWK